MLNKNKAPDGKDTIPADEDAIEEYEQNELEKIENPKEETDTDEHGQDAGDSEKYLTPETRISDSIPKSMFSMWIKDAELIQEYERSFSINQAQAYTNPQYGLLLYSLSFNTWNLIKHGFSEQKTNYEIIEKELGELHEGCIALGKTISKTGEFNGNWDDEKDNNGNITGGYNSYLKRINQLWANIMLVKAALGLSIRFKRPDRAKNILKSYRKPTDAIGAD